MAIVKGNYTRSRIKIKATIRYIVHRPTRTDKRITRALFGQDGALDRKQAYQLIDQAPKGTFFFRLVISPDAKDYRTKPFPRGLEAELILLPGDLPMQLKA